MERSPADEAGTTEVAVAELPSTSGAHWANRDALRSGQPMWFRRPPAGSPEPEAPAPSIQERRDDPGWNAFVSNAGPGGSALDDHVQYEQTQYEQTQYEQTQRGQGQPEHAQQLADTGASSRISFGVTDEPISGHWSGDDPSPISPVAPSYAAGAGLSSMGNTGNTGTMPLAVELPIRGADGSSFVSGSPGASDWPETPSYLDREPETQPFFNEQPRHFENDQARHFGDEAPRHFDAARQKGHHQKPMPARRSKLLVGATVALSGMVMLGAAAAGVAYFTGDSRDLGSVLELGVGGGNGDVATAKIGGRTAANFELVAATRRAVVRTQDLGDELFKITAAGDSGTAPKPTMTDNTVRLLLSADGDAGNGNVEVILSSKVTWALKFTGGADEQLVDMSGGRMSSMDLTGACRRVDLKLPAPSGTVPLRVTGAVEDLSLATPKGNPVRVQVDSGAQTVSAGARTLRDVKPGSTLTPKDWKTANRYDVDAESRLTTLTVRTL